MVQITFYVPADHSAQVKEAMFAAGAGRIGNYDYCSWETLGVGQFRALPGSRPFTGKENQLEKVEELKVEMVCDQQFLEASLLALKNSHPYETPAYFVTKFSA